MLEFDAIITNGYVDMDTIRKYADNGFIFVATVPSTIAHPYAMPTDKLSIFSKYTEPKKYEDQKTCPPPSSITGGDFVEQKE